ncbi:PAP2 superfamily protein [Chitinophaga sp. CF118]|uniref:phosphatase PAP2 family protein n=1 Tax=Chitinophaga sp. CF118 TaxID=1884367 RepID=UPI0008E258E6|nr:phosphatase PAP2 family protein [Chitinophaga sp. CF118]SFE01756.1 PAP2 superfamily protein [Chitinophaga sp. CF118]
MTTNKRLFDIKTLLFTTSISIAYLLLSAWLVGFKTDQLWLVVIFNSCYYFSWPTRRLITGFSIFIVYWILFDYMKAFPNYLFNTVHIRDLYETEKSIFGVLVNGVKVTPNEYWLLHKYTWLDVMSGIFYLCWVPVPLLFAGYLFYKDTLAFLHFAISFLLVNLIGFVLYYIYPAAPPWYIQLHGFEFIAHTPGNSAGLLRFDQYLNIDVFGSLYSKSSNVFAAMPSLHSAYPLIVLYYARKHANVFFQVVFGVIAVGIWFSAIYNSHHYILDVAAGIICAIITIIFYRRVLMVSPICNRFTMHLYKLINTK